MVQVVPGRYTARMDEPFIVFVIGMRINRPLAVRKWVPAFRAMGPMLRELYRHPEKGFLGAAFFLYRWGPAILQYWRSFEDLERFARNPDDPHLPAWQHFNRTVGSDGSVGIFHETYSVERGNYEAIYSNMPVFGLAKATEQCPGRRGPRNGAQAPHVRRERTRRALAGVGATARGAPRLAKRRRQEGRHPVMRIYMLTYTLPAAAIGAFS